MNKAISNNTMTKKETQVISDEIMQRVAILERDGWDMSETKENLRDINFALVDENHIKKFA